MPRPAKLDIAFPMSIEEISLEIGVSRQRTTAILHRALEKLKAELERRGWQASDVELERGDGGPGARMSDEGSTRL